MKPELYCEFEKQLKGLGYYLIVDSSSYKRLHEFVNVYPIELTHSNECGLFFI